MAENNVQLIRRILSGDDEAFSILMRKHQKSVHALVWRKVGDFHIAEEITQDTFIQVYKKLRTLDDPNRFDGWLYVIANHLCINWVKRDKAKMDKSNIQSIEKTSPEEIEESSYIHHMSDQLEIESSHQRQDVVKRLLQKLPESERTVVTLYYLGEMTVKEIGKFLGVSVNTIKSRLRRGRKRLQEEEGLVQETLGGVSLSTDLIENVMREISTLKPTPPPVKKPLLPWAALGTAMFLAVLLLGLGSRYLEQFQKPYSFEADAKPTVKLIDDAVFIDIVARPDTRRQIGRRIRLDENNSIGLRNTDNVASAQAWEDASTFFDTHWMPTNTPTGGPIFNIFATCRKTLYAATSTGLYRLTPDATAWQHINSSIQTDAAGTPMAEHADTLYIVSPDEIFASNDAGRTWRVLGDRPSGDAVGIIVIDAENQADAQNPVTIYLALADKGVYRSTDAGKQWIPINTGLTDRRIYTLETIGGAVFAGTDQGLYRLDTDSWHQLSVAPSRAAYSLAVIEDELYVGTGPDLSNNRPGASTLKRLFRSSDFGESWTEVKGPNKFSAMKIPSGIKLLGAGETLLVLGTTKLRSKDGGKTWKYLGAEVNSLMETRFPVVALDENTFYRARNFGIYRTLDGGESWHRFMDGISGAHMWKFVSVQDRLYAYTGSDIVASTDGGETWATVRFDFGNVIRKPDTHFYIMAKLAATNDALYVASTQENNLRIFRTVADSDVLIRIHGIPPLPISDDPTTLAQFSTNEEKDDALSIMNNNSKIRIFGVNGETFYVRYRRLLLKWAPGETQWTQITLIEDVNAFAASGGIVYLGKPNGKLLQSMDSGNSWRDITQGIPMNFEHFNQIIFAGSTVYVATDAGVLVSKNGEYWSVVTDTSGGMPPVIDKCAIDGTTVYGAGDTGVYRMNGLGQWEQIAPSVPGKVHFLVINNNKLYVSTQQHGMFHISLDEDMKLADSFKL